MAKKILVVFLAVLGIFLVPTTVFGSEISFEKNAEYLGDFVPQKIYEIQRVFGKFQIVSSEDALSGENGKTELIAVGSDENYEDFYVFRMTCEKNEGNCEGKFEEYITSFQE